MRKSAFVVSAFAAICVATPSLAQELNVRVGDGHRDHGREISRAHGEYRPDRSIIVRRDRDHDRRWYHERDHDRDRKVIIER
jgi:hypothetical protein